MQLRTALLRFCLGMEAVNFGVLLVEGSRTGPKGMGSGTILGIGQSVFVLRLRVVTIVNVRPTRATAVTAVQPGFIPAKSVGGITQGFGSHGVRIHESDDWDFPVGVKVTGTPRSSLGVGQRRPSLEESLLWSARSKKTPLRQAGG